MACKVLEANMDIHRIPSYMLGKAMHNQRMKANTSIVDMPTTISEATET